MTIRMLMVGAALALWGCNGVIDGADGLGNSGPSAPRCGRSICGATGELAAATAFPRLTHAQWENSVRDILRLDTASGLSGTFEPDTRVSYFDNNIRALRVSSDLWTDYQGAAESLAAAVTADGAALARLLPSQLPTDVTERARAVVRNLGRRVYRRPLSDTEVDEHLVLFEQGRSHYPEMDAFDGGVRVLLEAFLQSPHFIYRVELGQSRNGDTVQLSDFEIASRLAYMIWNTTPDDELLDEADAARLHTADQIAVQAARLMNDPRGQAMLERFHAQLFNWDLFRNLNKDPSEFPLYYAGVGQDMYEEARLFVEHVVLEENGDLAELLTAPYTFVNADLGAIYGIDDNLDQSFSLASFDPTKQPERGGLLTQLGFLASH
ncbi:MAG: DUF1592 domain-containing protein, partial [Polyangiales bacterium]